MPNELYECWNKNAKITTGNNPFDIMDPLFNIREMIKQMVLLEDHLNIHTQYCPDCIGKHMLKIEALADEAVSLDGGESDFILALPKMTQEWNKAWLSGTDVKRVAQIIRKARKKLMPVVLKQSQFVLQNGGNIQEVKSKKFEIRGHSQKTL